MRAAVILLFLLLPPLPAFAQTATPSPAPSPTAAAPVWHNPPGTNFSTFDPCGGPKELLNKFGPTPCVYVAGEAMASAGYTNVNTHGSLSVSRGSFNASVPISGNANIYPSLLVTFGLSPNAQLQLTAPSEVSVNSARFGTYVASSNPSFNYKQRLFFSPTKFTQFAVDLGYTAPIETVGVNSAGPSYQIQLELAQPLNANVSVGPWWTFKNAQSSGLAQTSERAWSDPLGIWLAWSPAAASYEIIPVVYHDFNPNRTIFVGQFVQLLSRHLSVALTYGGAETTTQSNGPFAQALTFATDSSPRVFGVNFYYLINESNLPPAPPAPAPQPTPTPAS